jgi:antitoxin MazE
LRAIIEKRGKSACLRIPAMIMEAAALAMGAQVDVRAENGRIVVEPVGAKFQHLESLLSAIAAGNIHAETDLGAPIGKEAL